MQFCQRNLFSAYGFLSTSDPWREMKQLAGKIILNQILDGVHVSYLAFPLICVFDFSLGYTRTEVRPRIGTADSGTVYTG